MALTKLTTDLNNVQTLPNQPRSSGGYTPAVIKELFDKAGNDIKDYINDTLTEEIPTEFATKEELQGVVLGQIPNNSLTELQMANDMKKNITGGVTAYDTFQTQVTNINTSFDNISKDYVRNPAYAVTTGTSTAYTVSTTPAPTAYTDGMAITINPHVACGNNPTLNWNGLGASTILKQDGSVIATNDIPANKPLSLVRVGSNFFIRSSNKGLTFKTPTSMLSNNLFFNFLRGFDCVIKSDLSGYYLYRHFNNGGTFQLERKTYNISGTLLDTQTVNTPFTSGINANIRHDYKYIYLYGSSAVNDSSCAIYDLNLNQIAVTKFANVNSYYTTTSSPCTNLKNNDVAFFFSNTLYVFNNGTQKLQVSYGTTATWYFSKFITSNMVSLTSSSNITFWDLTSNVYVNCSIAEYIGMSNLINYTNWE